MHKTNLSLLLFSTFQVWHLPTVCPKAVPHAHQPPILLTSIYLLHFDLLIIKECASVQGQTQGKEKGFSLIILTFPWTPLCCFPFFLIPLSLLSLPALPLIFVYVYWP